MFRHARTAAEHFQIVDSGGHARRARPGNAAPARSGRASLRERPPGNAAPRSRRGHPWESRAADGQRGGARRADPRADSRRENSRRGGHLARAGGAPGQSLRDRHARGRARAGAGARRRRLYARRRLRVLAIRAETRGRRIARGPRGRDARGRPFAAQCALHTDGLLAVARALPHRRVFALRREGRRPSRRRGRGRRRAQAPGRRRARRGSHLRRDSRHRPVERRRRRPARPLERRPVTRDARGLRRGRARSARNRSRRVPRDGHAAGRRRRIRKSARAVGRQRMDAGAVRDRFREVEHRALADRGRIGGADQDAARAEGGHPAADGEFPARAGGPADRGQPLPRAYRQPAMDAPLARHAPARRDQRVWFWRHQRTRGHRGMAAGGSRSTDLAAAAGTRNLRDRRRGDGCLVRPLGHAAQISRARAGRRRSPRPWPARALVGRAAGRVVPPRGAQPTRLEGTLPRAD